MSIPKPNLILLHGALGEQSSFESLKKHLEGFNLHTLDFEGHGSKRANQSFSIVNFAENVLNYMKKKEISEAGVFGYSMGGYVALYLAKNYPEKISRVSTLGTILKWDMSIANREIQFLNPDKIEEKVPKFAEMLQRSHPRGWKTVVKKTAQLLSDLGEKPPITIDEWTEIQLPVRLHVGDRDETAGVEQTLKIYHLMKNAELSVLPGTPHQFKKADVESLAASITNFF